MKTIIATIALASVAIMPAAQAEDFTLDFTYNVSDMQSEKGAKEVYRALEREVRAACSPRAQRNLTIKRTQDKCVKTTMEKAVKQIQTKTFASSDKAFAG